MEAIAIHRYIGILRRCVKVSTFSSPFPSSMIWPSWAVFIPKSLVLSECIFRQSRAEMVSSYEVLYEVFSCTCWCVCNRRAKSSAKSRYSNCFHIVHCIPFLLWAVVVFI